MMQETLQKPKFQQLDPSGVVYSTGISDNIRSLYRKYQTANGLGQQVKTNAAFIAFAQACEHENKYPLAVAELINAE